MKEIEIHPSEIHPSEAYGEWTYGEWKPAVAKPPAGPECTSGWAMSGVERPQEHPAVAEPARRRGAYVGRRTAHHHFIRKVHPSETYGEWRLLWRA